MKRSTGLKWVNTEYTRVTGFEIFSSNILKSLSNAAINVTRTSWSLLLCKNWSLLIMDFFSKCDKVSWKSFPRIWFHLLKKSFMDNFISWAVLIPFFRHCKRKWKKKWARFPRIFRTGGEWIKSIYFQNSTSQGSAEIRIPTSSDLQSLIIIRLIFLRVVGG